MNKTFRKNSDGWYLDLDSKDRYFRIAYFNNRIPIYRLKLFSKYPSWYWIKDFSIRIGKLSIDLDTVF